MVPLFPNAIHGVLDPGSYPNPSLVEEMFHRGVLECLNSYPAWPTTV